MEIEAKVRVKDPVALRASLSSAGATFEGRVLERNWLYDHPERTLARADKLLRLRQDRRVSLTFKGPRHQSEYKKREELEIEFPDASSATSLLKAVGFVMWFYYEKMRETWRLGSSEVVLDELPSLGLFVEIEGPTEAEIEEVVRKLKLPRDYITSTYVEMLDELPAQADKRFREFTFPSGHESALATGEDGAA
jgi:adenylate cyclase class 2